MKRTMAVATAILCAFPASGNVRDQSTVDPLRRPIAPEQAARWLTQKEPVRVFGNTYSVGFGGLTVGLIRTSKGLILIDGAVPQSVDAVEANIRKLGLRVSDVRYILSTEPHYDHAGGIAAIARDSGATVVASAAAARALRTGRSEADDPQFAHLPPFPAVSNVRAISDGETLRLGDTIVTARATPGHTAGSMSWTWRSCEGSRCLALVFGASLNPVSADGYLFSDPSNRSVLQSFRRSFAVMRALPCDILLASHPVQPVAGDGRACKAYADREEQALDRRLGQEAAGQP